MVRGESTRQRDCGSLSPLVHGTFLGELSPSTARGLGTASLLISLAKIRRMRFSNWVLKIQHRAQMQDQWHWQMAACISGSSAYKLLVSSKIHKN